MVKRKKKKQSFDISNKTLAVIVTIAILVSLFSLLTVEKEKHVSIYDYGITGLPIVENTTIGNVTAEIQSYTYINFTNLSIDWGAGYVNTEAGHDHCNLTTDWNGSTTTTIGCAAAWASASPDSPLVIENLGNEDVALNLTFSHYGFTLFPATEESHVMFRVFAGEGGIGTTCLNNSGGIDNVYSAFNSTPTMNNYSKWTTINDNDQNFQVCPWFNHSADNNAINIGVKYVIDSRSIPGNKTLTITAYGRTCDGLPSTAANNCTAFLNNSVQIGAIG